MQILNKISRYFSVPKHESHLLWSCINYALIVGICQGFLEVAPMVLFLSAFDADWLPSIYLVTNLVLIVTGVAFKWFEARIRTVKLFSSSLAIMAVAYFLLWGLLAFTGYTLIILIILVLARLGVIYTDLALWVSVNKVMTLQQGKRFFPFVVTARSLAGVLTGLLIPVLLWYLSVAALIFLVGVSLCIAIFTNIAVYRHQVGPRTVKKARYRGIQEKKKPPPFLQALMKPHSRNLLLIVFTGMFTYYAIDIYFNQMLATAYSNKQEMASFLGVFNASIDAAILVFGGIISRIIFQRYGVFIGNIILPLGVLLLALFLLMNAAWLSNDALFALAGGLKFWNMTLLAILSWPGFLLLSQSLKPNRRVQIQSLAETIVNPASGIIASSLLASLVYYQYSGGESFGLIISLLALTALLIYISARRSYHHTLTQALTMKSVGSNFLQLIDKRTLKLLMKTSKEGALPEVRQSLFLLHSAGEEYFVRGLAVALHSREQAVVNYALQRLVKHHLFIEQEQILELSKHAPNRAIQARATKLLAHNNKLSEEELAQAFDDSRHILLRQELLHAILMGVKGSLYDQAVDTLIQWTKSRIAEQRMAAAHLLTSVDNPALEKPIKRLYSDSDIGIKKTLLFIHSRYHNKYYYRYFDACLSELSLRSSLLELFYTPNPQLLDYLISRMPDYSLSRQQLLIRLLAQSPSEQSRDLLWEQFTKAPGSLLSEYIGALDQCGFCLNESQRMILDRHLAHEFDKASRLISVSKGCQAQGLSVLELALSHELERVKKNIHHLLLIKYPEHSLRKALLNLHSSQPHRVSYAIELVSLVVSQDDNASLTELLLLLASLSDDATLCVESEADLVVVIESLRDLIDEYDEALSSMLIARVIQLIGSHRLAQFQALVMQQIDSCEPVVREAALWAMFELNMTQGTSFATKMLQDETSFVALTAKSLLGK